MALKKCRECGNDVSSTAKACLICGIKSPVQKQIGCIPSLIVIALVFWVISNIGSGPKPNPVSAPISTPKTAADVRKERITAGFSQWDGSHIALEKIIKQSMHNPDSYKHVKTTYKEEKDGLLVATQYRGTNAFGGVVTSQMVAKTDLDGNVIKILSQGK